MVVCLKLNLFPGKIISNTTVLFFKYYTTIARFSNGKSLKAYIHISKTKAKGQGGSLRLVGGFVSLLLLVVTYLLSNAICG